MLEIRGLRKSFSSNKVLKEINLNIERGEIVGLLGKNGAGKTTLVKSIMQLLRYDGEIVIDGEKLTSKNLYQQINFLLEPAFLEYTTAFTNLKYLHNINNKNNSEAINRVLKLVGLKKDKNKKVKDYSYGMKQRLGLAQALMECRNYLILDEPTVGIDPIGMKVLLEELRHLARDCNIGILLSSHELEFIKKICDRVLILEAGEITDSINFSEIEDAYLISMDNDYTSLFLNSQVNKFCIHKLVNGNSQVTVEESKLNDLLRVLVKNDIKIMRLEFIDQLAKYY